MKTVNEHIAMIEEHLQAYKPTDDFSIPRSLILAFMNTIRSALIRQDKFNLDSSLYQIVDCLEVECIERDCSLFGYNTKIDGISVVRLPMLVSDITPFDIRYLGGADLASNGTRLSLEGFVNFQYTKWTKDMFHYCIVGNKAYLKNLPTTDNEDTKLLTGVLLLDNPVDACNWTDKSLYPSPSDYRLQVLTIQHILSAYRVYPDEYANARHDLVKMGVPQPSTEGMSDENEG